MEVVLTNPAAMERMDRLGWKESSLTGEQANALLTGVKLNMSLLDGDMFYDGSCIRYKRKVVQKVPGVDDGDSPIRGR
jgi:hypothetical protein